MPTDEGVREHHKPSQPHGSAKRVKDRRQFDHEARSHSRRMPVERVGQDDARGADQRERRCGNAEPGARDRGGRRVAGRRAGLEFGSQCQVVGDREQRGASGDASQNGPPEPAASRLDEGGWGEGGSTDAVDERRLGDDLERRDDHEHEAGVAHPEGDAMTLGRAPPEDEVGEGQRPRAQERGDHAQ